MLNKYKSLKEKVLQANLRIKNEKLAIYTWGNVSQIDRNLGVFAIKPSGLSYEKMTVNDIVVLDLLGNVIEGDLNPSSDTPTHLELYKSYESIGGICHTHSPYASAWAQSKRSIPILGTTHADHIQCPVPCTRLLNEKEVYESYEKNTGLLIIDSFDGKESFFSTEGTLNKNGTILDPSEVTMVLVAGHGPFTWGEDASKSVYNAAVLEEIAKMAYYDMTLNQRLHSLPKYIIDKHYFRKHGSNSYYGQKK